MNPLPRRRVAPAIALSCVMATSACTSFTVVSTPQRPLASPALEAGERVRVTGTDGTSREFRTTRVTADAVEGNNIRIAFTDIARLEARRFDKGKTWIVLGTIGGIVVAGAAAYAYAQISLYPKAWEEPQ